MTSPGSAIDRAGPGSISADFRPLYTQVRDMMVGRIGSGAWKPGEMIPSEFQLAAEFGVSQGTVRKALIEMEQRKLVVRRQGRGTYVSQHSSQQALFHFFRIVDRDGVKELPTSVVVEHRTKRASKEEAASLGLAPRAAVHFVMRVRHLRGRPVIIERIILPTAVFRDLDLPIGEEMAEELYVLYQRNHGVTIVRADERIAAVVADEADARFLEIAAGAPLLEISRIASDVQGNPVELRSSRVDTADFRYSCRIV
ncbi:MAG TPA: GntR family transcriptional regulator [Arenibaculum sp.]|nr:GntR family transcriptional regulator [Arenibaculum sp.]